MKFELLVIGATYGLVYGDQKTPLSKRAFPQFFKSESQKAQKRATSVNQALTQAGYVKGASFLEKLDVFQCSHVFTQKMFVCKVQDECSLGICDALKRLSNQVVESKPMEAQVFELIQQNSHPSLATMHQLVDVGLIEGIQTYLEVLDYYKDTDGWSNLDDYIRINFKATSLNQNNAIFKQIVAGVAHLYYKLKISHSDIKGNLIIF
jgi:serine/threonine protein kinase